VFTIDLLKGQGVPIKSRPEGIAIAAVAFVVPVIIAIVMFGYYVHTRIVISVQKEGIANYEDKISELSDAIKQQKSFEQEKDVIKSSLSEVLSSVDRYVQWSPILETLVRSLPDSVILTKLEAKERSIRMKVPQKDNPDTMEEKTIPVRTLQMSVCGYQNSDCDKAVREFQDSIRSSTLLGPKIEDIKVAQGFDKLEGKDVISYEIDCTFKPQL